jgi:hypothetical protein
MTAQDRRNLIRRHHYRFWRELGKVGDADLRLWEVEKYVNDLEMYLEHARSALAEQRREAAFSRKIAALRGTKGRTPADVETGRRLAERLQAKRAPQWR